MTGKCLGLRGRGAGAPEWYPVLFDRSCSSALKNGFLHPSGIRLHIIGTLTLGITEIEDDVAHSRDRMFLLART